MKREQDPRFRHLEIAVGAFVTAALAALIAAIVYIGIENRLFTKKYHLRFTVDRGTGFSQGMPVKLSGFRIGRVKEIGRAHV
jgi:phospholipid/cholesterol/gamma-HCH transport system substrate-binding protein